MIYTVEGDSIAHAGQIQFAAMEHGLETERVDTYVDIVVHDNIKLLNVIRAAGGRIIDKNETWPLARR